MNRWVFFFLLVSCAAVGQTVVEGVILDKDTGKPVPFASIGIEGTAQGTSSNMEGQFSIMVHEPFSLRITCLGYSSTIVKSKQEAATIQLIPTVMQLNTLVVTDKEVNPKTILRKALAAIPTNYSKHSFKQQFFYRHYCKDGGVYGRLIEAYVDVWKNAGYRTLQPRAGIQDAIEVTQLRRSIDKTTAAQGHEPIAITNVLQADIVGYQMPVKSDHLSLYTEVSNLKADFDKYSFSYKGMTYYDDQQVYEIDYTSKKDSALTTSGKYVHYARASGSLFITTDTYAFVKAEDTKTEGGNTIKTSVYYRKQNGFYYPYHLVREGENLAGGSNAHVFHIEMVSVEIKDGEQNKFITHLPNKKDLFSIPYDSAFWSSHTLLKTTPLENTIISDLGGGASLNKQFERYRQYELNVRDGGDEGEKKFTWLKEDSKGQRILYLLFWSGDFQPYLKELELAKRLQHQYRNKITFILLSLDDNAEQWQSNVQKYSLFADGIINYRIGSQSALARSMKIKEAPSFVLLSRDGSVYQQKAKAPSDSLLINDFNYLMAQSTN